MKKIYVFLIIIQAVSAIVLILFSAFANYKFQSLKTNPYGLSDNYTVIEAPYAQPLDGKYLDNFYEQLRKILERDDVTVIHDDVDLSGLGIYDTKGTYLKYNLKSGKYFDGKDFSQDSMNILVQDGSFADKYSEKNNGVFNSNTRKLKVIGVTDKSNPLFDGNHEYICTLFSTDEFRGTYYIDSKDMDITVSIKDLFDKNGFQPELSIPVRGRLPFFKSVIWLYQQKYFNIMMFGIVIIYFNFVLFFIYFISRQVRKAIIHLRAGATKYKLFLHFTKHVLPCCILGSMSGAAVYGIIYYLLQRPQDMYLSVLFLSKLALLHSLLAYFIFAVLFYMKKYSIEKGGAGV